MVAREDSEISVNSTPNPKPSITYATLPTAANSSPLSNLPESETSSPCRTVTIVSTKQPPSLTSLIRASRLPDEDSSRTSVKNDDRSCFLAILVIPIEIEDELSKLLTGNAFRRGALRKLTHSLYP